MKERKKNIILIIAIALVIVIAGGGTYAYWQWVSANNTVVNVVVPGTNSKLLIDGGGNITTKTLAPAACTNTTYAIQRKVKVTAINETTTPMLETLQLTVNSLTAAHGTLDSTAKANLKWALVESNATQHATSTWLGCTSTISSGNFGNTSTGNTITLHTTTAAANPSAAAGTSQTTTNYYELYIWIDPNYEGPTTTGTNVTDPLQDLTLNLSWTGSMTNTNQT